MIDSVRGYPDISFVEMDTNTIKNTMIAAYEAYTGRTLYPADPARLFVLWVAEQIVLLRSNIDFSAKQNLIRYAEGDYLDSLAELFKDCYRLDAEYAQTTLEFSLSIPRNEATMIPQGTRVSVGEIYFATEELLEIPANTLTGDVVAHCSTAGEIGNGFTEGQLTNIVDIFPYYQSVTNITTTDGGADVESDDAFYERLRGSMETFSTAGTMGAYAYHAMTASALIADVVVFSPEPGIVDVRAILEHGELPSEEVLQKIYDVVNADDVRALTDYVRVSAPDVELFNIDVTYYIQTYSAISTETILSNVEAAIQEYQVWQCEKMGRDINPSKLIHLLYSAGVKRVEVKSPEFKVIANTSVAQVGDYNVMNGGFENE